MAIAAFITWVIAAFLGFVMLSTWLARGGARRAPGGAANVGTAAPGTTTAAPATAGPTAAAPGAAPSRIAPPLIFGHFLLAATGLVLWVVYLFVDASWLTWVAFGILVVVGILGESMFLRWRRSRTEPTPESRFPVGVVYGHGLFAAATVVLVFLSAIGVGES